MAKEYFPTIGKIPFEGAESKNPLAFHYYDAEPPSRALRARIPLLSIIMTPSASSWASP